MQSNKKRPPASDADENWKADSSAKTRKVPRRKIPTSPTPPTPAPNYIPTSTSIIPPTNTTTDITTSVVAVLQEASTTTTTNAIQTRTFLSSQHPELSIAVPINSSQSESTYKHEEGLSDAAAVAGIAAGFPDAGQHYPPSEHLGEYIPRGEHELEHHHHHHQQYEHHEDDQRDFDPSIIAVHALHQQLQQHHLQLQQSGRHQNMSSVGGENQGHHHDHEHLDQGHDNHLHLHQLHDPTNGSDSGDSRMARSEHSQDRDDHGLHSGDGGTKSDGALNKRNSRGRGPSQALRNLSSEQRRDRRLQRNRAAAKECRNKKKAYIMTLEEKCTTLEEENARLLKQVDELNAKFTLGTMRQLVNSSANGSNLFNNHFESNMDAAAADINNSAASEKTAARPPATLESQLSNMAAHAAVAVAQAAGLDIRSLGAQLAAVASAGAASVTGSGQTPASSEVELNRETAEPRPSTPRQNDPSSQSQSPSQQQSKVACA